MIKYVPNETSIVFEEVPDEITMALNISNCRNKCKGCHSPHLRTDIGEELNFEAIDGLIAKNGGITCICFMGEGNDAESLKNVANYIRERYPELKLAIYSGKEEVEKWYYSVFDYIKFGPYMAEFGPLNERTTNQRMLHMNHPRKNEILVPAWYMEDITYRFWK